MQTKQPVINTTNHQPSAACREKACSDEAASSFDRHSRLRLAVDISSSSSDVHMHRIKGRSVSTLVPASDAIANCTSMPNRRRPFPFFPREDTRGVDTLDLHAEGLRPNTTFAVFLTELPVPPFGAVQYIGDFTTNAAGRGHVRVDAIIDEAFAFNNITWRPYRS
jgi:hypothetical protein